ncbi:hypothetical protein GQ42DRAFT_29153 [Ramicandelaber brevisporus]|nr:hypothetical protein GQ42DRAFT_29153 [Ramicandelaber brevisporus]
MSRYNQPLHCVSIIGHSDQRRSALQDRTSAACQNTVQSRQSRHALVRAHARTHPHMHPRTYLHTHICTRIHAHVRPASLRSSYHGTGSAPRRALRPG